MRSYDPQREQALRKQVGEEIARHKAFTEDCGKIFRILASSHSQENLRTVRSISDDLRTSSANLRDAIEKWNKYLNQEPRCSEVNAITTILGGGGGTGEKETLRLKAELAKSQVRLAEQDVQIKSLLKDGLRLAFKKEELEKRLPVVSRLGKTTVGSRTRP